jgi:hypothetical protein
METRYDEFERVELNVPLTEVFDRWQSRTDYGIECIVVIKSSKNDNDPYLIEKYEDWRKSMIPIHFVFPRVEDWFSVIYCYISYEDYESEE